MIIQRVVLKVEVKGLGAVSMEVLNKLPSDGLELATGEGGFSPLAFWLHADANRTAL